MNIRLSCIAPLLFAHSALFAASPGVRLERDVPVLLRLKQSLSSETARLNDRVEFEVVEDVIAGSGAVAIPSGSIAWGKVADAVPRGRMLRNGRLAVDIDSIPLPDGSVVRLRATSAARPPVPKSRETAADSIGALPALPVAMFQYGRAIEIPEGKQVTVYTAAPVVVTPAAPERTRPITGVLPTLAPPSTSPAPAGTTLLPPTSPTPSAAPQQQSSVTPTPILQAAPRTERPEAFRQGNSKRVLTVLAAAAAAGLAGVLAARSHGGGGQTSAPGTGTTPGTSVGLGPITVGGR